jgi:hypothetical protein
LARSGQVGSAAKPILEINPRHDLILALASENDPVLRETLRTCCSTKRGFWMASFQLTPEPFRSAWHGMRRGLS